MTAPTIVKTWQFDVNQVFPWVDSDSANRTLLLAIKNSLIGFPLSPWVVAGSSNSVAAGMDGVDRWATTANLVYGGGNHSWIVLQQDGINPGFQVCIDFRAAQTGTVAVSPANGFTGGAINARPTATDEYTCTLASSADAWWGMNFFNSAVNTNLHVMMSTDGECTRIFNTGPSGDNAATNYGNPPYTSLFACFEKLRNPVAGFTIPHVSGWLGQGNASDVLVYTTLGATGVGSETFRSRHNGTTMRMSMSWDYSWNWMQNNLRGVNTFSGEYPMVPIGAYCPNTATRRGRHGEFFDMWAGNIYPTASFQSPDADNPAFVKVGQLYLPWDGVSPTVFC